MSLFGFLVLVFVGLAIFGVLAWKMVWIPVGALIGFFGFARFSVVAMRRDFDARAAALQAGFNVDEDTTVI